MLYKYMAANIRFKSVSQLDSGDCQNHTYVTIFATNPIVGDTKDPSPFRINRTR